MSQHKTNYDCPSQNYTVHYYVENITEEEETIYKSESYCYRLYIQGLGFDYTNFNSKYNFPKKIF